MRDYANSLIGNFGVTFPLMEKIDVNGEQAHPLYEWLKKEKKQLMMEVVY